MEAGLHIPWTEIVKFFELPTLIFWLIFGQSGDNCKYNLFVNEKQGSENVQDRQKPNQSYSNGHLPHRCSFQYLARALDA